MKSYKSKKILASTYFNFVYNLFTGILACMKDDISNSNMLIKDLKQTDSLPIGSI
jgi:hypothetical protein